MTTTDTVPWEEKRTDETRMVEDRLRPHFEQVDAYRYNSASIRVLVIDPRFASMNRRERCDLVEEQLGKLPVETQVDIINLFLLMPAEQLPEYYIFVSCC